MPPRQSVAPSDAEDDVARQLRLMAEENDRITVRLRQHNLARIKVAGDGNCFFACVALAIYNDPLRHPEIRNAACDYLQRKYFVTRHWDDVKLHVQEAGADSIASYLRRLAANKAVADSLAILAVAHVYNLSFRILSSADGTSNNTLASFDVGDYPYPSSGPRKVIKLLHVARRMCPSNSHYDLLLAPHEEVKAPGSRRERRATVL